MRFDPDDGSKSTQSTVKTGTLAAPPEKNTQRESFQFDGWTYDGQPFDFQMPILQDTTLKAQWTKTTDWTLSPDHGPASGARLTISPPSLQEPYYISIHTFGERFVGLTGDGRIYTWTQDSTPRQVPTPAQAPDGFHYLQSTADDQWQAALGSDQKIYAWNSQQPTPTILNADGNIRFTSISMNDDRLLAVDRQGRIHTYQASDTDSQGLNLKFTKQAVTSLPGRAQAVTATTSSSRTLIVDADGQAWTWDTSNTRKAKPERIKQDPHTRIIQAQALSQGFILLDTDGQAWYLAGSTASMTPVSLPDGAKASQITANKDQAMITGTDGSLRVWKPGETPVRADNGNQPYVQAASIGSRVTAISRQGCLYRWSLDGQGQHGRPARLDTTQAPILESASLDGQPLKLTKNNNLWQADMPAHKPEPAAITITGRQDGQPFTRNLNYTVDQTLTRDAESETSHTVDFNTGEGSPTPDPQQVSYPYGRVQRPSPDPVREGYQFSGWFIGEVAYDFSKPVTGNLILTAKWTPKSRNNKWRISPDKGSQLGNEATTITPPDSTSGVKFNQITNSIGSGGMHNSVSLAVGSDGNAYAWGLNDYGQLGDGTTTDRTTPVMVRKPDSKTYPDLLADFTYVQVSAGYNYSLAVGSDGYVYAWGRNNSGQLGNNSNNNSKVPVRVRDPANPRDTSKGLKAVQVDAGGEHSLAVDEEGNAYAWGRNNSGQLGNNTSGTYSGSSVPVRVRDPANPRDTSKGLTVIKVSAGGDHSLAIDKAGDTWAWGYNIYGQLGNNTSGFYSDSSVPVRVRDPNDSDDASKSLKSVQISAGYEHSLAIDAQGNTWSWGWNYWGELGQNTTSNIISTPSRVCDPNNPTIAFKTNQISAGYDFSLAIDNNGNTWSWGRNDCGELGYNSHDSRDAYHILPARVRNPAFPKNTELSLNSSQISAGNWHSLSIGKDGNAYAWGNNSYGQLGNNTTREADSPVLVVFNLQLVITGVKFDQTPATGLKHGDGSSVSVLTPAHQPGTVTVSVDYTLGGAPQQPDTSLKYTYLPAGVLPRAGGEGILLALATGMTGMGGVLASRRHRREQHQLLHASHE